MDVVVMNVVSQMLASITTTGCSDFTTYKDALRWYEKFYPFYGDVAKLDRDGDGVPCPGLPHTRVAEKYRMKVPTGSVGVKQQ